MVGTVVTIPVYNAEKYVKNAIESILNQTYDNFVLYICDDCSKDNSYEICKSINDKRIILLKNEVNLGTTKTLNRLMLQISANHPNIKYMARQDADDWSLPTRLEEEIWFLETNIEYGMVGTWYDVVKENGDLMFVNKEKFIDEDIRSDFFFQNWFCHGSIVFRMDAIKNVGIYDDRFYYAQDYELYSRVMQKYKVANIAKSLYKWRNYERNLSKKKIEEQRQYLRKARYKMYCELMRTPFNITSYRGGVYY